MYLRRIPTRHYLSHKRDKSNWLIFILIFFLFLVLIIIFNRLLRTSSLIAPGNVSGQNEIPIKTPLQKAVEKAMEEAQGTYSIVIKNMKTGENLEQLENKSYEPGSLYKLWLMSAVFEKISLGEIKEGEILSRDIAFLNKEFNIAPRDAEMANGVVTLSVKDALHQMIAISHNYAALLLLEKLKTSNLKAYIKKISLLNSDTGTPPRTTPADTVLFLEKLYKGELVSPEYSKRMMELLKEQKLNDGLPKYLPEKAQIAHKTGDIGYFKHDAGIVFADSGDYIIVVFSESKSPGGAQERIALLSKAVYEYFTSVKL